MFERTIVIGKNGVEVLPRHVSAMEKSLRRHLQPTVIVAALVFCGVLAVKGALALTTGNTLGGVLGVAMLVAVPVVLFAAHVAVQALTLGPVAKQLKQSKLGQR